MSQDDQVGQIKEGLIDKVQEIFEMSKRELQKVQCEEHGQALLDMKFDRTNGRFQFDTCCEKGEELIQIAINNL
ncbi:MAG: hypothetical protein ACPGJV_13590 [Bacteriovoracaceae bacterium]